MGKSWLQTILEYSAILGSREAGEVLIFWFRHESSDQKMQNMQFSVSNPKKGPKWAQKYPIKLTGIARNGQISAILSQMHDGAIFNNNYNSIVNISSSLLDWIEQCKLDQQNANGE